MKTSELDGHETVICNCSGAYYAIQRRCGHKNAPLELGTLDGNLVMCPMHWAQFDVTTGKTSPAQFQETWATKPFRLEWLHSCNRTAC